MKNLFRVCIGLLLITFIVTSCKKDDNPVVRGTITYDGTAYSLTKGYIANLGTPFPIKVTINTYAIFLASSSIQMPSYAPPIGTGSWLGIRLWSSSTTSIVPGSYFYTDAVFALDGFTGEVMLDASYPVPKSLSLTDIESGTLNIDVDGNNYIINFAGTITGGSAINASYTGPLTTLVAE